MEQKQDIINQIELERANQKINLERAEALKRLFKNEDFIKVFRDYYMGIYLKNLVTDDLASATADITKASAVDKIKAIGLFDQFIKHIDKQGVYAQRYLESSNEELLQIYEEVE